MSYQVLARKWRPRTFQEMIGQEHILRMLTNALDSQRLHHAYLFTGTRGVGKTTLARIFAKCLNCEAGVTSTPCNTCSTCQAINNGKFLDLIEVDAASRTKVEDTRELLENVQYSPTQGRYKVYLIDEVHMLSGHSFNALLKTLEEPPAHVKFLLATTEPKRLPITILSRCLQFHLHHVPVEKIAQHLATVCQAENIAFETEALALVAQAADGSMRDALSLLDQTIAWCADKITLAETQNMLGTIDQQLIYKLLDALAKKNGIQLLNEITTLAEHGANFSQLLEDILSILHKVSVAQIIPDAKNISKDIQTFAETFSAEDIQLYYQIGLIGRRDLPLAPDPHQGFEMIMLRMLAFQPTRSPSSEKPSNPAPAKQIVKSPDTTISVKSETRPEAKMAANPTHLTTENWSAIVTQLPLTGMAQALASHCALSLFSDNAIELTLAANHESLLNKSMLDRIEQALNQYLGKSRKLTIKTAVEKLETPALQQEQKQAKRQADATASLKSNEHVQKIIEVFDATLDLNSITAT